jgi:putative ABC transport system ATP-binding protein
LFVVNAECCCAGGHQLHQNQHSEQAEALIVEQFIPKQENITESSQGNRPADVPGEELAKKNDEQLTIFRRRNIGFIFQNYNLVPILNVYENIALPVELDGDTVDQKFLDEIVHLLGLEDKLKNMPNNLSGGQQQRVAIARALITKPAIVLADEPTGNLDSKTSAEVLGLIKRTSAEFRQTVVMITHNNDIARLADRIVRIEDGKIVE